MFRIMSTTTPCKRSLPGAQETQEVTVLRNTRVRTDDNSTQAETDEYDPPPGFRCVEGHMIPTTCSTERLLLASVYPHPRDSHILFDEGPHTYYVHGVADYTSCTTFIHSFFPHFDQLGTATRMVRRSDFMVSDRYSQYRSLCTDAHGTAHPESVIVQHILRAWEQNAELQSGLGTRMHRAIELFYNGEEHDVFENTHFDCYNAVVQAKGWRPFRTEMVVYDEESKLCGSVDMIFIDSTVDQDIASLWGDARQPGAPPLKVHLADWKRSKKITKHGFGQVGHGPCSDIPNANFYLYTLQLNLYRYMLEKRYNVEVQSMSIVVCHPTNDSYLEFIVDDEQPRIQKMVQSRLQSLAAPCV